MCPCSDCDEIPVPWQPILGVLTRGASAWLAPAEVARALGRDPEAVTDELAELHLAGWIEVWERAEGLAVILSPWGADRLQQRLVEWGGLSFRWTDARLPELAVLRARGRSGPDRDACAEDLGRIVDPAPGPGELAEAFEAGRTGPEPERAGRGGRVPLPSRPPYPSRLIGQGLTPWPGPGPGPDHHCPACADRCLAAHEYCLRCDRWGQEPAPGPDATGRARPPGRPGPRPVPRVRAEAEAVAEAQRLRSRRRARHRSLMRRRADARTADRVPQRLTLVAADRSRRVG